MFWIQILQILQIFISAYFFSWQVWFIFRFAFTKCIIMSTSCGVDIHPSIYCCPSFPSGVIIFGIKHLAISLTSCLPGELYSQLHKRFNRFPWPALLTQRSKASKHDSSTKTNFPTRLQGRKIKNSQRLWNKLTEHGKACSFAKAFPYFQALKGLEQWFAWQVIIAGEGEWNQTWQRPTQDAHLHLPLSLLELTSFEQPTVNTELKQGSVC